MLAQDDVELRSRSRSFAPGKTHNHRSRGDTPWRAQTESSFVNSWIVTHRNGAALNTRTVARSTLGSSTGSLQFSILPTMLFVGVYDQCTSSGCMYVGAYVEAAVRGRLSTLTEARRTLATFVKFKVKGAILYPIS